MTKNKELQFYRSVMKQKQKLNIGCSIIQKWENNEWLLVGMSETLNNQYLYTLIEFCEDMEYTPCGICSIAVTEEELDEYFYEDRKLGNKMKLLSSDIGG